MQLRDLWSGKLTIDDVETSEMESLLSITFYKYQSVTQMLFDRRNDMVLVPRPVIESQIQFYLLPYSPYVNNLIVIFNPMGEVIISGVIIASNLMELYDRYYSYTQTKDIKDLDRLYI